MKTVEDCAELANEWVMQYVDEDHAPMRVGDYIRSQAVDDPSDPCEGCNSAPVDCLGLAACVPNLRDQLAAVTKERGELKEALSDMVALFERGHEKEGPVALGKPTLNRARKLLRTSGDEG